MKTFFEAAENLKNPVQSFAFSITIIAEGFIPWKVGANAQERIGVKNVPY